MSELQNQQTQGGHSQPQTFTETPPIGSGPFPSNIAGAPSFPAHPSHFTEAPSSSSASAEAPSFIGTNPYPATGSAAYAAQYAAQYAAPILECRNLSKNFGGKAALTDVTMYVPRGQVVGLLGPNGSGKSTLIKLANGLICPTQGEISVNGKKPGIVSKQIVSYLPEKTYLNDWMKVEQLISFFADFYSDFNRQKANEMLSRLGINAADRLRTLSKGTKEKVQLILVMSREAELYLLDEPIGGVDPAARDYILDTIIRNYSENATIIISTHLIYDIERILDYVFFLNSGRIALASPVDVIRNDQGKSVDMLFREVFRC